MATQKAWKMENLYKALKEERDLIYKMYLVGNSKNNENVKKITGFNTYKELEASMKYAISKRKILEKAYEKDSVNDELFERFNVDVVKWWMQIFTEEQFKDLLKDHGYTDQEIILVMALEEE